MKVNIKWERNGKRKEYNKYNELIFEGEYLNGIKNGKGKEYVNGKLIFKGEYLNGKKWNGKGIEYNLSDGQFIKVNYLNGKIKGKFF